MVSKRMGVTGNWLGRRLAKLIPGLKDRQSKLIPGLKDRQYRNPHTKETAYVLPTRTECLKHLARFLRTTVDELLADEGAPLVFPGQAERQQKGAEDFERGQKELGL